MIKDNTQTTFAKNLIFSMSSDIWDKDLLENIEYAFELENANPVLEGIKKYIKNEGVDNHAEVDKKQIIKELNKRYKEFGINDGTPRVVRNWLDGRRVGVGESQRKNLYDLCMILRLNKKETDEFFLKYFLTIPFNYKNRIDAIYLYCIYNGKSYDSVKKFLEVQVDNSIYDTDNEPTREIENHIIEISDDEVFTEYLRSHRYPEYYSSAREEIRDLLRANAELAEKERRLKPELNFRKIYETGSKESVLIRNSTKCDNVNVKALLDIIYGYDNHKQYKDGEVSVSKCKSLPKRFREDFPNDQEISNILNGKGSAETIRKTLIILKFYNFFCSDFCDYKSIDSYEERYCKDDDLDDAGIKTRINAEINADLDDFYVETSKFLEKYGFVQLYVRNPFDWMILLCAKSIDPLGSFRDLLAIREQE